MARLKLFIPLIVVLLMGAVFWYLLGQEDYDPQAMPSALEGKTFPEFALPSLTTPGETIKRSTIVGEPMLVNIWASWCPTCYYEHPYLMKLSQQGVKIIGINYKDDEQKALNILNDTGNPYAEVIVDKQGMLGLDLGVTGAPETFVVNPEGVILLRFQGALDQQSWQRKFAGVWQQAGGQALLPNEALPEGKISSAAKSEVEK